MRTRMATAAAAALVSLVQFAGSPAATAATSAAGQHVVTLPTGQQVALYGPPEAPTSFGPPPGVRWPADDPLLGATMGGHLYAIPRSAIPDLGEQLSAFDLTRLASGTAVAPQTSSTAAGSGSPHNMWTLTIGAVDQNGQPAYGVLIQLVDVDDAARFALTTGIGVGPASFSVPAGDYSLVAIFVTFEDGHLVFRTDVHPQFTVNGPTSVLADARRANVRPSTAVSRPADLTVKTMTVTRTARKNGGLGIFSLDQPAPGSAGATFLVNPTAPVSVGDLHYDTYWHYASPDAGASYAYDLDYPADGAIPSEQDHHADDAALAAIDVHYASEVAGQTAAAGRTVIDLAGLGAIGYTQLDPLTVPARRTEYVSAGPDVHWQAAMVRLTGTFEDWFTDAVRTYLPGSAPAVTWLREPLAPGVDQFAERPYAPLLCPACRQGDILNLLIAPYADSAGHVAVQPTYAAGAGDVASASFRLSSGGTVLATGDYAFGVQVPIPHAGATYRLDYDVSRSAPWWTLSTSTGTTWTFGSGPTSANLPPGWFCDFMGDTACNVLPLLFADYRLPTDDAGHQPVGPVTGEIDVHHLQGAAQTAIASVSLQVSFDDGQSWQPAQVSAVAPGRYEVHYTNPASASTATLRLTASDAGGNTLVQTVHEAYAITG